MEGEIREEQLTVAEFCLVAGLLGAGNLIGIDDPWTGFSTEQVGLELGIARSSLAARNLIEVRADNRILVDPALATIVSACAFPEEVCILTHVLSDLGRVQRYFYLTRNLAVELAPMKEAASSFRLIRHESGQEVYERVVATFRLQEQPCAALPGGELPQEQLGRLTALAAEHGDEAVRSELIQLGQDAGAATAVAALLAHPLQNGSLAVMAPVGEEWQVDGLGLLEGVNGLWRLRFGEREGWVALEPVSAEELKRAIAGLIGDHLPAAAGSN